MHFAQRPLNTQAKPARLFAREDIFTCLFAAGERDENIPTFKANGGGLGNKICGHNGMIFNSASGATDHNANNGLAKLEGVFI